MSWRTVFEGDLLNLRRSRLGPGVGLTVFVFTAGIIALVGLTELTATSADPPLFDTILLVIGSVLSVILPFIAMLASYSGIVHERERGSVRFLLGLPNSRLDAYLGKYLSRSLLLLGSLAVGLLVVGGLGGVMLREPSPVGFVLFGILTAVYGLIFVGIGLALSALVDTETSATTSIIGTYVLFRGGWPTMQWGGLYLLRPEGEQFLRPYPEWYFLLGRLNPMNVYVKLVNVLFNDDLNHPLITSTRGPEVDYLAAGEWYAVAALALWLVVVPAAGYLVFRDKDLL